MGGAVSRFLAAAADPRALDASRVLTAWAEVAGEQVASRTLGGRFRDGTLHVQVDSHAWADELRLMGETFRRLLNERLGKETVRAIRFTVSEKVKAARRREEADRDAARRYEPRGRAGESLDAEERRRVSRAGGEVADAGVAEALRRAMEADLLRRKRGPEKG